MNGRLKSALIFCLKLVVTAVPAYFVYRNIVMAPDWSVDDLYRLFSAHSIWPLFVALLCLGLSNFTACLQWKLLLEKQNVKMGYGHLLKLYYVGLFFNNFMPGNVGGDAKKVYDIRMQGGQDSVGAGLTATFFDRLYGLFFITLFALAMGLLFFMHDEAQRSFMWPSVWIFLGSALTQGLRILVHYFCGIAVGVDLSISWYFYYIPLVAIVSALPISIGGFGPRELLAQSLFARAGVPGLESVVIQLLAYFVSLVLSLFGAFVFLLGGTPAAKVPAKTEGEPK